MKKRLDLKYQRFGCLRVSSFAHTQDSINFWNCVCDCGRRKVINGGSLRSGNTKSCGCRQYAVQVKKDFPLFNQNQKRCSKCDQQKPATAFQRGVAVCNSCRNARRRQQSASTPRVPRTRRYPTGHVYVYLIRILGSNRYKIGKTINPDKRFREFQLNRPWERIQPIVAMQANDEDWPYDERATLKLFADHCIGGEWFEFDDFEQILMAFLNHWPYEDCEEFSSKKRSALEAASARGRNRFGRTAEQLAGLAWSD